MDIIINNYETACLIIQIKKERWVGTIVYFPSLVCLSVRDQFTGVLPKIIIFVNRVLLPKKDQLSWKIVVENNHRECQLDNYLQKCSPTSNIRFSQKNLKTKFTTIMDTYIQTHTRTHIERDELACSYIAHPLLLSQKEPHVTTVAFSSPWWFS